MAIIEVSEDGARRVAGDQVFGQAKERADKVSGLRAGGPVMLEDMADLRTELEEVLDELEDEASSVGPYDEWYPDGGPSVSDFRCEGLSGFLSCPFLGEPALHAAVCPYSVICRSCLPC